MCDLSKRISMRLALGNSSIFSMTFSLSGSMMIGSSICLSSNIGCFSSSYFSSIGSMNLTLFFPSPCFAPFMMPFACFFSSSIFISALSAASSSLTKNHYTLIFTSFLIDCLEVFQCFILVICTLV